MNIDSYIRSNGITATEFATRCGISPSNISKYRAGKLIPTQDVMRRIYDATGGAVTANDFYGLAPESHDPSALQPEAAE